jgi:hypothetical protein
LSAPGATVMQTLGISVEAICQAAKTMLARG